MTPLNLGLTLRNSCVVGLSAGVCSLLQLPEGLFLVLAAFMTLDDSLGKGEIAGRERLVGTLCGSVACLLILGLGQWHGLPAAVLAMTLARVLGLSLGLNSGFIVGGHVVAASVAHHTSEWLSYVLFRTAETLFGVLIGVVAARQLIPVRASNQLEQQLRQWNENLANLLLAPEINPLSLQASREQRDDLLDLLRFAREELSPSASGQQRQQCWGEILFHGEALLGFLRDLQPLLEPAQQYSKELAIDCFQLRSSCGKRLLTSWGPKDSSERAQAIQIQEQSLERLQQQIQWLEKYLQQLDHNALSLSAVLVQRSRQINAHTTALDQGIQKLKIV
ncbi:MAG: FUSC family protein [Synechococcus lacustris]